MPKGDSDQDRQRPAVALTQKAGGVPGAPVQIELSPAQVGQVVRAARGHRSLATALRDLADSSWAVEAVLKLANDPNGNLSSSLIWGLIVFAAFPKDGSVARNADLARSLGLSPSTTHRYLSTLVAAGVLEKDLVSRGYRCVSSMANSTAAR
jgi:hypothetical protein